MDDLFVYRAGLSTLEEYLEIVKGNLETYYNTPGRRYHSLEQSSFNAWIKLYRPDENSKNSSISYYLKGGLVFNALHALLFTSGHSVDDLLECLWTDFLAHPERGVTKDDVYFMIKKIAGDEALSYFQTMVETTEEIDFDLVFKRLGCELKWSQPQTPWIGVDFEFSGERAFVKHVQLDSPASRYGLNTGDEILSLNGLRFLKEDVDKLVHYLQVDVPAEFLISRLSKIQKIEVIAQRSPRQLKEIIVIDRSLAESAFKQKLRPVQ
jgi:predicted metalloprotease with PDZ domain